jgi:hypothetical protein
VENVEVDKIQFSILHGSTEVMVIDYLTKTGVGSFINTVLWDSAGIPIDQGQSPYTGTFIPQQPLSNFNSADPAGQWIIKITYSGSMKSGVIKSWGISITYNKVQPPTTVLMPLAIGNYWIVDRKDPSGNFLRRDTFSIPYTAIYNGKTVYRWYMSMNHNDTLFMGYESNGLWMYSIIGNWSQMMWKYPVNLGEWWIGGHNGNDTIRCLSTNETVITPIGTFTDCIEYKQADRYNSMPVTAHAYVKPGLGFVAYDIYDINLILQENWKLVDYHLNK